MSGSNWANRTKTELQAVTIEPDGEALQPIGGREEIVAFYGYNASKTPGPKSRVLTAGQEILGTYVGTFKDKTYGKSFHKVTTPEGLVAVAGSGQLDKYMDQVAEGAKVQIVYRGKNAITSGKFAGKEAHTFNVNASKRKA